MSEARSEPRKRETRTPDLAGRVGEIRTRRSHPPVERGLMIAGATGIALGLPLILLGWLGASRTPYVFEQIPYLISGGLLGLALAVVGGLAYFAYWMTRQVRETQRQADRLGASLDQIARALASGAGAPSNGSPTRAARVVATAKGTMFHRPDCQVVAGRGDLREVRASDGLEPCKICDPA